jgi:tetratricopeptide (TPR) repeat protein
MIRPKRIADHIRAGERDEAIRVLRECVYEVRRDRRPVKPSLAFKFAELSRELQLWPETEFWGRVLEGLASDDARLTGCARLFVLGALMEQGRTAEAVREAELIAEPLDGVDPAICFQLHLNCGVALYRMQRSEEAIARFERADQYAAAADVGFRAALDFNRGAALRSLGRTEEALDAYIGALDSIDSEARSLVLINMANALRELERFDESREYYEQAWEATAEDDPGTRGAILSNFSELLIALDERERVRALLEEAVELRGRANDLAGQAHSLSLLAAVAGEQYDYRTALDSISRAVESSLQIGLPVSPEDLDFRRRMEEMVHKLGTSPDFAARVLVGRLLRESNLEEYRAVAKAAPAEVLRLALSLLEQAEADGILLAASQEVTRDFLARALDVGTEQAAGELAQEQEHLRECVEVIRTISNVKIWLDRKRFYESRRDLFESDRMRLVINSLPYGPDWGIASDAINSVLDLIERCRQDGIDIAFAALPPQDPDDLPNRLIMVGTWRESLCLMQAHPEFYLSDAFIEWMNDLPEGTPSTVKTRIAAHGQVIRRCHEIGITEAFSEVPAVGGPRGATLFTDVVDLGPARPSDPDAHPIAKQRAFCEDMDKGGDPGLRSAARLILGREYLSHVNEDPAHHARAAVEVLQGGLRLIRIQLYPHLYTALLEALGQALLTLSEVDPAAETQSVAAARSVLLRFMSEMPKGVHPEKVRRAALSLDRAIAKLLERATQSEARRQLYRERLRACQAAMTATDDLVRTGSADVRAEAEASLWAFQGAVEELFRADRLAEAMTASERGRGRSLLAQVSAMEELPGYVPEALRHREKEARERIRQIRADQASAQGESLTVEMLIAERNLENAYRDLSEISPELGRIRSGAAPATDDLVRFARTLGPDELLLTWYTTRAEAFAFALLGGTGEVLAERSSLTWVEQANLVALAARDLGQQPSSPSQPISPAWSGFMDKLVPARWSALIAKSRTVFLVPHALLHELPLHALPLPSLGGRSLIELTSVKYLPSVDVARSIRGRECTGDQALIVASAGESPDGSDAEEFEREARYIASLVPSPLLLTGGQATVARLARFAPRAAILHVAAHGYFDASDPLASAVHLSHEAQPGGVEGADRLTAGEVISRLRLPGTTVVLSGCETGRREVRPSDDGDGLAASFFIAGAGTVVASLWRVSSPATSQLMKEFYRGLTSPQDVSAALREATLNLRGSPAYRHPYYWAPFVTIGG